MIPTLIVLCGAAAVCLGLSRFVPTRVLGFLAAGAALLAAVLLVVQPAALDAPPLTWAVVDGLPVVVGGHMTALSVLLLVVLLGGSALALLALALALAPEVRGFGNLFAWALLAVAAAVPGLCSAGLVLPLSWATTALLSYAAVRASGALNRSEELPQGIAFGLLASLVLLAGLLAAEPARQAGVAPGTLAVGLFALASLMYAGGAPFRGAINEATAAPAPLGGLLFGLVLPLLGLGNLIQFIFDARALFPTLPELQRLTLLVLGALSLGVCAAGALRAHRLRNLLGWLVGAQAGLVVLALGLDPLVPEIEPGAIADPTLLGTLDATLRVQSIIAAPVLLVSLALSTLSGALAAAVLERTTGSDDYTQVQPGSDLRLAGLLWLLMTLVVVGVPPSMGFWGRYWLFLPVLEQAAWVLPLVLAASVLLLLACLGPLARFAWRSRLPDSAPPAYLGSVAPFVPVVLLLIVALLALGVVPQLLWFGFLQDVTLLVSGVTTNFPAPLPIVLLVNIGALLVLLVLQVLSMRLASARPAFHDADMEPVVLAPDSLAQSLTPLSSVGHSQGLLAAGWSLLLNAGRTVSAGMVLFEKRFYLAGVLVALISLILLMAQG